MECLFSSSSFFDSSFISTFLLLLFLFLLLTYLLLILLPLTLTFPFTISVIIYNAHSIHPLSSHLPLSYPPFLPFLFLFFITPLPFTISVILYYIPSIHPLSSHPSTLFSSVHPFSVPLLYSCPSSFTAIHSSSLRAIFLWIDFLLSLPSLIGQYSL